jgi:hypothetical protein
VIRPEWFWLFQRVKLLARIDQGEFRKAALNDGQVEVALATVVCCCSNRPDVMRSPSGPPLLTWLGSGRS